MNTTDLRGSNAFITGGGRGIGRAAALALADAGVNVAVCARSAGEVDAVAREVEARGGRAFAATADVTDYDTLERAVRGAEEALGPLDVLVVNAGIGLRPAPLWEVEPEAWWRVQEVNVLGAMHAVRAAVPGMVVRGRGRVIHVASLVGARPSPRQSAYACSKAALMRLNDTLAAELEGTGVTSFAMSPGLVMTNMTEPMARAEGIPEEAFTPIGRGAALIVRLASGEADALSGRMIHVEDDLDALIARADEVREQGLYELRLVRGLEGRDPA